MRTFAPRIALLLAAAAFLAVLPRFVSDYRAYEFAKVGIYFIALLGLNILTGYAGQISLGHGGFMAIGAYTTAILSVDHGVRDIWTIPLAGVVAGIVGFAFGFPALRYTGVYLALATFAIPVALISLIKRFEQYTGGGAGKILPLLKPELGVHTTPNRWLYYVTWTVGLVLLAVAWLLVRGRTGRALRSIREAETAAISSGVNPTAFKTFAFGISAFYAGVAGALLAMAASYVNPDTFPVALSILLLVGVVVGGLGSITGTIFGALFVAYVPLYAPNIYGFLTSHIGVSVNTKATGIAFVVYGVILLIVLYVLPSGAAGLLHRVFRPLQLRAYSRRTKNPQGQVTS